MWLGSAHEAETQTLQSTRLNRVPRMGSSAKTPQPEVDRKADTIESRMLLT